MSTQPWAVGVVIPARNEDQTIALCLSSVLSAADMSERCGRVWVVVVADGCTDGSVSIAREILRHRGEVIECEVYSPGSARRIGVQAVLAHFRRCEPQRIWLANTDADTRVPVDWLSTHLSHADSSVTAVAGIVELDAEGLRDDVKELYRRTYTCAADGKHDHVHGANFGLRARCVYRPRRLARRNRV